MGKNIKIISICTLLLLLGSCGFKKINSENARKINIQNIDITGDRKIIYYLRNDILLISNEQSKNRYTIKIETRKERDNKIKNQAGRVTRYSLTIYANLNLKNIENNKIIKKTFVKSGDYNVSKTHSETINNESAMIKNITQQLSEVIINYINLNTKNL